MSEARLAGRPPYEPTATDRRRVAVGKACGMTHDLLAAMLEIDADTLAKHFAYELTTGAAKRIYDVREAIERKAKKGDVSAARLLSQWRAPAVTPESLEVISGAQQPGVKAQRNQAAKTAQQGTEWQTLLHPATAKIPTNVQ